MFVSARMKKIELLTLVSDEPSVTEAIGEMGVLHLTHAPAESGAAPVAGPESHHAEAHIQALETRADSVCSALGLAHAAPPETIPHAGLGEVEADLGRIESEVAPAVQEHDKLAASRQHIEKALRDTSALRDIDAPVEQLERMSFLHFALGTMPVDNAANAGAELGDRALVLPYTTPFGEKKVIALSSKKGRWALESVLEKHGFRREKLPDDYKGVPSQIAELAEQRLQEVLDQVKANNEAIRSAADRHGQAALALRRRLRTELRIAKARENFAHTSATMLITGWLPAERVDALCRLVLDLTKQRAVIEIRDPLAEDEEPPTLMKNHPIIRPFEMLVSSYSIPHYDEIEPTPFLAVLFLIMFGMMFGDLGHSGLLLLAGALLWARGKKKLRDVGVIVTFSAVSGMIFGAVYGSVFGFELGGKNGPFYHPLEHAQRMLATTVLFGVVVISLGIVLNVINRLRQHQYAELWLSRFGVVGAIFYWGSLVVAVRGYTSGSVGWLPVLLLVVAPLAVIFLRKPFALVAERRRARGEDESAAPREDLLIVLIESAAEAFETVLAYVANTLSFARVGAFALAHAGLCLAVFEMIRIVKQLPGGPVWSVLVFLLGTILIVLLEGFIVAIQSLRLEYYEFFSKFFRGEGRRYEPFDLKA